MAGAPQTSSPARRTVATRLAGERQEEGQEGSQHPRSLEEGWMNLLKPGNGVG